MVAASCTRFALSVWQGRVAPVFDVSRELVVLEMTGGRISSSTPHTFTDELMARRERVLARLGVETLICGAISSSLARSLEAAGVRVIPFVAGEVGEVIGAFAAGELPCAELSMPGCRCWRGRGRRRAGGRGER
jgi:predicted Fe-Mo cluster-binding NifX family protein